MDDFSNTLIKTVIALLAIWLGVIVSKKSQRNWLGWITFFAVFFWCDDALGRHGLHESTG